MQVSRENNGAHSEQKRKYAYPRDWTREVEVSVRTTSIEKLVDFLVGSSTDTLDIRMDYKHIKCHRDSYDAGK